MNDSAGFLRKVLLADGVTSGLTGVVLLVLPAMVATLIGAPSPALVAAVGLGLVAFGGALVLRGRRQPAARTTALVAVALNLVWLAGSAAVLLGGWLNAVGNWALVLVGDVVLAFSVLEVVGLRRIARSTGATLGPSPA